MVAPRISKRHSISYGYLPTSDGSLRTFDDVNVLSSSFVVDKERKNFADLLWRNYWDDLFQEKPFRIMSGKNRAHNSFDPSASPSIYFDMSDASFIDYDKDAYADDIAFKSGNLIPKQLAKFKGSLAERHLENAAVFYEVGPRVYERMAREVYNDPATRDLFLKVLSFEGPDVFWKSLVDDEDTDKNGATGVEADATNPRARACTSLTKFGALTVCMFPFFAEIRFDDVDERVTFSLERAIRNDSVELLLHDLQELVVENSSDDIAEIRHKRMALRVASDENMLLSIRKKGICGSTTIKGTAKLETVLGNDDNSQQLCGRPTRGFDMMLRDVVVQRHRLVSTFWATVERQNKHMFLTDLIENEDVFHSKVLKEMVEQVKEEKVDQAMRKRTIKNTEKHRVFQRKIECLSFDFEASVYADSDIGLVDLYHILKNDFPAVFAKMAPNGRYPHQRLLRRMLCIVYLKQCRRSEALWFMHWLQIARQNNDGEGAESRLPSEVVVNIDDCNSFLYRSNEVLSILDLANFGFDQTYLKSLAMRKFWERLTTLRNLERRQRVVQSADLLKRCISTLRLDAIEIGVDIGALEFPEVNHRNLSSTLASRVTSGTDQAKTIQRVAMSRIKSIMNSRDVVEQVDSDEEQEGYKVGLEDINTYWFDEARGTKGHIMNKAKQKFKGMLKSSRASVHNNDGVGQAKTTVRTVRRSLSRSSSLADNAATASNGGTGKRSRVRKSEANMILHLNKMLQIQETQDAMPGKVRKSQFKDRDAIDEKVAAIVGAKQTNEDGTVDDSGQLESFNDEKDEHTEHDDRDAGADSADDEHDDSDQESMASQDSDDIARDVAAILNPAMLGTPSNDAAKVMKSAADAPQHEANSSMFAKEGDALYFDEAKQDFVLRDVEKTHTSLSPGLNEKAATLNLAFSSDPLKALQRVSQLDVERGFLEAQSWIQFFAKTFVPQCRPTTSVIAVAGVKTH